MGFFQNLRTFRNRVTGEAEKQIRTRTMKEAANLFDWMLDEFGWDAQSANSLAWVSKRTARTVASAVTRNLRKYDDDAYVKRGVNLHTDFAYGRGVDVPKCKSDSVQEVVTKFWKSSVNQRNFFGFIAQQRRHKEAMLAGEMNVLAKIDPTTSQVKLYPLTPQEVIEVIPDPDESTRPAFYLLQRSRKVWNFQRNEWEMTQTQPKTLHRAMRYKLLEASDQELGIGLVYHVGLNEFFDQLRGRSDIETVEDAAESARDMADDGAALSRANADTAYKVKVLKGGKNVKDAYLAFMKTKTDGSNPAGAPASDWVENDALSRDFSEKRDTGANFREKDMRAQKLMIFAGLGFGEHYMGDPSSGNLATATAMELPVLKMIQAEQKFWACVYSDLVDFAIDMAVVANQITGKVVDQDEMEIETEESRTFSVNFPPITQKQIAEYMIALKAALDSALIPDDVAARLALDLFEVQDIDEVLDELFQDKEVQAELDKLRAQSAAPATPMPGQSQAQGAGTPAPSTVVGEPESMSGMQPIKQPAGVAGGNGNGHEK